VARYDKAMSVAKLRGARERMRGRGELCEGRKPFGEREGEQVVIDRIRALRRKG
jgi:hypothetical protein